MGLLDLIFGNKQKEEQLRLERERQAEIQRKENVRIAKEREARLAENRRKEEERKVRTLNETFTFQSNQHQRYEAGKPVKGIQNCIRTITLEKNLNGCSGYKLAPGDGYIIKIFNDDLNCSQMADKPMRIIRQSETSIEFRGFPIMAQTPFGWQEIDLSDYGLIVYYESGVVSKCALHMYDRNTFIEYRKISKEHIEKPQMNSSICEAEQYAIKAREAAANGNTSLSHRLGIESFRSFVYDISQIHKVKDVQCCALALGKMMEGDNFTDNDTISKAVAISYYFLTKAIKESSSRDPYLFVYRFSITYEYNKAFYSLFAHSEGEEINYSPFDILGQSSMMAYEHHLQGMQMSDMFTEPRVGRLDNALNNIFHDIVSKYSQINPEQVKQLGNQYHDQIYNYIVSKIKKGDLSF